jgi:alpha-beta hydrolase superfamily lysophospholipase
VFRNLLFAVAALAVAVLPAQMRAAGHAVTFRGDDGRTITGTLVEANRRPSPAVVLVGMLGRSRDDWQGVADHLADANITALAIDLPGQRLPADSRDLASWHTVIGGSLSYLAKNVDVRPGSFGVAGASLGANLGALAAASDGRVRALALVSPSVEYRGVRIDTPLRQYGSRPALLIASLHDPYAARSVRELSAEPPGPREVQWTETVAHGTVLLARDPDIARSLVDFFRRTLGAI